MRLVHVGAERWSELNGYRVGNGATTSLMDTEVSDFTDYVWWYITRDADQAEVDKFKARLWRPPAGEAPDPRSPWAPEQEMDTFKALQAALSA